VSATVAALEDAYTDADLFETICQIRGDELDDAGTHEVVHHIRGKATPAEQACGCTKRASRTVDVTSRRLRGLDFRRI
jgi:hypothetical protein